MPVTGMRSEHSRRTTALALVVALVTAGLWAASTAGRAHAATSCLESASRCNVLFVETDDQSIDTLIDPVTGAARTTFMPKLAQQLATGGGWYTFTDTRAQDPLCGPSRWGQLIGQTSLHHGVTCNALTVACVSSSYQGGVNKTYLAALQNAGYWNSWVGKFVNWYPCGFETASGPVYRVPAGVDDWHAFKGDGVAFNGGYSLIESSTGTNAHKVSYPTVGSDADYGPYVFRDKTLSAIDRCAAQSSAPPCLWQYNTNVGHSPGTPPNNYDPTKVTAMPAHWPSYNEGCAGAHDPSIADKASFEIANVFCDPKKVWKRNKFQRPLQAEDTSLASIIARLKADGLYDNTIIIYTSDHGYSDNENNHISKQSPYEPAMRVPLLIRVPGAPGGRIDALSYLPDLTATLYDIAGASPLVPSDGASLLPLLRGEVATVHPNGILGSHLLVSSGGGTNAANLADTRPFTVLFSDCTADASTVPTTTTQTTTDPNETTSTTVDPNETTSSTVDPNETTTTAETVTTIAETTTIALPPPTKPDCYALIRWKDGQEELYDLTTDPYELKNLLPNATTGYRGVAGWDSSNPIVQALESSLNSHIAAGA